MITKVGGVRQRGETSQPGRSALNHPMGERERTRGHAEPAGGEAAAVEPAPPRTSGAMVGAGYLLSRKEEGAPLPDAQRAKFERSLGADLGAVRVHAGGASAGAAEAVQAQAFTVGNDVHFGAGRFDPGSRGGERLLAHEVAHTLQQAGAPARQDKLAVSGPGDAAEREADRIADAMVDGAKAPLPSEKPSATLHRAPAPDAAYGPKPYDGPAPNWSSTVDPNKPASTFAIADPSLSPTLRAKFEVELLKQIKKSATLSKLGATVAEVRKKVEEDHDDGERKALWQASQYALIETLNVDDPASQRYKKSNVTFCIVYAADMVKALGGYLPYVWYAKDLAPDGHLTKDKLPPEKYNGSPTVEINANQLADWLVKWGADFGWKQEASLVTAQNAANDGRIVVCSAFNTTTHLDEKTLKNVPNSGHVSVVIAESADHHAKHDAGGAMASPLQSQAGDSNYKYSDTAAVSPSSGKQPGTATGAWWDGSDFRKDAGGQFWIYQGAATPSGFAKPGELGVKLGADPAPAKKPDPAPSAKASEPPPVAPPSTPPTKPTSGTYTPDGKSWGSGS